MIRLPASDLESFKQGIKHYYGVPQGNYARGQRIVLYNGDDQALFTIENMFHVDGILKLGLRRVKMKEFIKKLFCKHTNKKQIFRELHLEGRIYRNYGSECLKCGRTRWL